MALLHKPVRKDVFSPIILRWISLHLKSIVQPIIFLQSSFDESRKSLDLVWSQYSMVCTSKSKQGRNHTYSDTAIQCCLMMKVLFHLTLRMVTGFVQSLIRLCWLAWTAPDYSTICRRQKHIDISDHKDPNLARVTDIKYIELHNLYFKKPYI